jgi:hypothetical protein
MKCTDVQVIVREIKVEQRVGFGRKSASAIAPSDAIGGGQK